VPIVFENGQRDRDPGSESRRDPSTIRIMAREVWSSGTYARGKCLRSRKKLSADTAQQKLGRRAAGDGG
jgi:hypothetical protein